ncbi:MAG: TonB-dependent receptor [Bacteroidales bacterium]|nr:TonB-dependent receptor [Bacteroidales bacterium]
MIWTESAGAQNLARIYGKVTDTSGFPIEAANIVILNVSNIGNSTNESGRYDLLVPHDKDLIVEVSCVGYQPQQQMVSINAGKRKQLNFELIPSIITLPLFDVSERYAFDDGIKKINPKVIHHLPGLTQGVESLIKSAGMGVFSNNEMSSQYNVRGGSYDENLIYLNGIEIYRPFLIRSGQQEGLSFINPDLVSSVKFSSGGFDPCYGDKMSSVLDVNYRRPTQFAGSLFGSLLGASGHVEGASKDQKFTVLFGARYQSNAYLFRQLQTKGSYNPTFTDGQLLLTYCPSPKWEFTLFGNYARNVYRLIPESQTTRMGLIDEVKEFKVFYTGQEVDAYQTIYSAFVAKYNISEKNSLRFLAAYFNSIEKETFDLEAEYFINEVNTSFGSDDYGKVTSSSEVGKDFHHARNFLYSDIFHGEFQGEHQLAFNTLNWGLKLQGEIIDDELNEWRLLDSSGYSLPHYPTTPGETVPDGDSSRMIMMDKNYLIANNTLQTFRLSGFIQDKWSFGDSIHRFALVGGIRFSYWTFNGEFILTPRLRLMYQPKIKADISVYVATGMYYQPPFYKEMRMPDGILNKDIQSQKSYHVILGMDYLFKIKRRPFKLSTEIYYKYLYDQITYTMDNVRIIYSGLNDAIGHIAGIDVKLSGEIVYNLESWIAVSLMKGIESINGNDYTPRPTDQRFSLNLFFQDRVPKLPMLKAHINLIYSTPLPYSPPTVRNYVRNALSPHYFRADIGFSWQFIDGATRTGKKNPFQFLNASYLTFEIANIFDFKNVLSYSWISDMEGRQYKIPNYLTPRLFNIKLRFEF